MKFSVILFVGITCLIATTFAASRRQANVPATAVSGGGAVVPVIAATLSQDLEELSTFIPMKMINKLFIRYLLNDAEFQAVVRILNSYDAFIVRMRFRSQPETMMFHNWVRAQLLQSGGSFELEDSMELNIFSMSPYWANSVYGWQGFINEFMSYYPQDLLRAHIDMKVAQNGIFAQFWQRLKALKPVYERVLAYPESQRLIAQLQASGVDVNQLDQLIRTQFDWVNLPVVPTGPGTGSAQSSSPANGANNVPAVAAVVPATGQTAQNAPVYG